MKILELINNLKSYKNLNQEVYVAQLDNDGITYFNVEGTEQDNKDEGVDIYIGEI